MSDLHERLTAAVNARLELARAATPGPWTVEDAFALTRGCRCLSCYETEPYGRMIPELNGPPGADTSPVLYDHDATFIAANDPATVIRHCERDLSVLRRHTVHVFEGHDAEAFGSRPWCGNCRTNQWPCGDLLDLAADYDVDSALPVPDLVERGPAHDPPPGPP